MAVLSFQTARETVIERVRGMARLTPEQVPLAEVLHRVLAEPIYADRDFPPFPRATRDGYAVRADDIQQPPVSLRRIGQIKAGESFSGSVGVGECVEIMTGAPVPDGSDAVVMVEHTRASGESVELERGIQKGENVVPQGSEARQGDAVLSAGRRIQPAEIALLAAAGRKQIAAHRRPLVGILPTGDEVVEQDKTPTRFQIRNSNGWSLRAQVAASGCIALPLGIAPDREDRLREMIQSGLQSDLLVLSGGVSMGKFDLVETVLAELGAEIVFDGVSIQPGRPLVFGHVGNVPFFGLPGNPLSTMVTFELFVCAALQILSGERCAPLLFLRARLGRAIRRRAGLAAFLPALLEGGYYDPVVSPVSWQGSGDLVGVNRANCYLALPEEAEEIREGDWVSVLPR